MYPIWVLDCPTLLFSLNLYVIPIDYFEEIINSKIYMDVKNM